MNKQNNSRFINPVQKPKNIFAVIVSLFIMTLIIVREVYIWQKRITIQQNQTNQSQQKNNQETKKATIKHFTSRNKKLSFTYKNDWVCKEVIYNERVDCYPETRLSEEYDAGLDELSIYYPDISISIKNCVAKNIPQYKNPDITLFHYLKNYNGCIVVVLAEDNKTNTEEKLDNIIFN